MKISWSLPLDPAGATGETSGGMAFTIRPIRSTDGPALEEAFEMLSPESRYLRFFSVKERLGSDLVKRLTDIDHDGHRAWVVFDPSGAAGPLGGVARTTPEGLGVAIARLIEIPGEPGVAEAALVVADAFQGRGFGRLLLELLIGTAQGTGVSFIRFETLRRNAGMKKLLQNRNVEVNRELSDREVLVFDLPVPAESDEDVVALGALYDLLRFIAANDAAANDAASSEAAED